MTYILLALNVLTISVLLKMRAVKGEHAFSVIDWRVIG